MVASRLGELKTTTVVKYYGHKRHNIYLQDRRSSQNYTQERHNLQKKVPFMVRLPLHGGGYITVVILKRLRGVGAKSKTNYFLEQLRAEV